MTRRLADAVRGIPGRLRRSRHGGASVMLLTAACGLALGWSSGAHAQQTRRDAGRADAGVGTAQTRSADAGVPRADGAAATTGASATTTTATGSATGTATTGAATTGATTTASGAATTQPPSTQAAVPWAGVTDVEAPQVPSFLDTTDQRIRDERPPPSAEQVAALREMEAEVERFTRAGTGYRESVGAILRREYMRQRRNRDQWYARQVLEEERLQNEARERAITLFERFIQQYPNDPTYTPDAMFRLGELYFERSAIQFQDQYEQAQEARERGEEAQAARETPDFNPTIELYQRLVETFPDYRRIDGVYYLIGYCLNEMGRTEEARMAWLALVCGNKYQYDPTQFQQPAAEPATDTADAQTAEHPSLNLDGDLQGRAATGAFVDPYDGCTPVRQNAEFISETWFRVGEYHFDDYGDAQALDKAISAYNRILTTPEDRNYNLALYKVAWAYYRASRYPEAIRHFGMLVQWSDDERQRTGRAGSELRPEAIQYLGISFAYDDWNENQVPDPEEGAPTGLQRIQDGNLLPQDRAWTPEVYFHLGQVYFDEAKYPQAVEVWRLAIEKWPLHPRVPEITNLIARAHARHNEFENAIAARAELTEFGPGSQWWDANLEHPAEQRQAEQLAENALIGTAVHYHQEAQQLRNRCVEQQNPALCNQAQERYMLAARAYREYLQRYPNNPQAYELQYNLADALYWSGEYEQAAREYAAVRDSNLDDTHLSEAARRVVESLKRLVDDAAERGQLPIRNEPPAAEGQPPQARPIAMPELLQRLAQAREMYLARVSEEDDTENVREAYDYNNALLLYYYGYWPQARQRFERIFSERCRGPHADETGRVAWLNLRNMAVQLNDTNEVERLGRVLQEEQCTFAPDGTASANVDCSQPENRDEPRCLAGADLTNIRYRRAVEVFDQAGTATGDQQRQLYEQAATMLVQAVNDEPNHPQAPLALEKAAIALERTSRFDSAARLYQRIIDEVGPRRGADAEEQKQLDAILANAYFRLAFNANRFFDYDRAVQNYRVLGDSERFSRSADPTIIEKREDALINSALILENLQQYPRAAEYYRRAAATLRDPEEKRRAQYRLAEMSFKQRNWNEAIRAMREFSTQYGRDPAAGELVVQAQWRIAQSRQAMGNERDYRTALQDVVTTFARSGQEPGSLAAEYAAEARFRLADRGMTDFEDFTIRSGQPRTLEAYLKAIVKQRDDGAARAQVLKDDYDAVAAYRRPQWTIAAYVRQGRVYEVVARALLNTSFVMPSDLQRQVRSGTQEQRDEVRAQVEDAVRQNLDQWARPIECSGVVRYALAARVARAASVDNEYTRQATDRLQAYGDERIAECLAQHQQTDASFTPYQPGEFRRAPRGQSAEIDSGTAPPALAPAEGR